MSNQEDTFTGTSIAVTAVDGLSLPATLVKPEGPCLGTVLALPGIGYPRRSLRHWARYLGREGYRVLCLDYRGMWGAGGDAGLRTASLLAWARLDAVGALRTIRAEHSGPHYLLAHSFAGQMLGISPELSLVNAAATIGTGFGSPRLFDGKMKAFVWASWNLTLPFFSSFMTATPRWLGIGEKLPSGVARQWAQWGRADDWFLSEIPRAREYFSSFARPLLSLRATDDEIAPLRATEAFLSRFDQRWVRHHQVDPKHLDRHHIGHGGLLRPNALPTVGPLVAQHFAASASPQD